MSTKKRPKVPDGLIGIYWRVRWVGGYQEEYMYRRNAIADVSASAAREPAKLYRVTVWRRNR